MECVVLFRLNNDDVVALQDSEEQKLWVAKNVDEAIEMAESHPLALACPFQVIELDEL